MPTVYFIVLAPVIGMVISGIIHIITINICRKSKPSKVDNVFRRLQLLSSAAFSLGHGGSDAQKVIGIIAAAMLSQGLIADIKHIPPWVPVACYTSIALGTIFGGWRIVKTMGQRVTKLTPFEGFSAETAGALTLFGTQHFKIPVSTTHTITGSIIGVGAVKRVAAVRWGVTRDLLIAWVLLEVFVFRKIRSVFNQVNSQLHPNQQPPSSSLLKGLQQNVNTLTVERKDEIERLQKLEIYRKELLGNVSHELKTPIFNIQGYIHTLLDGAMDDKNINREYLQRAGKSVDRMIAIVEDLQTITQLEKGELELDEERFDAVALSKRSSSSSSSPFSSWVMV